MVAAKFTAAATSALCWASTAYALACVVQASVQPRVWVRATLSPMEKGSRSLWNSPVHPGLPGSGRARLKGRPHLHQTPANAPAELGPLRWVGPAWLAGPDTSDRLHRDAAAGPATREASGSAASPFRTTRLCTSQPPPDRCADDGFANARSGRAVRCRSPCCSDASRRSRPGRPIPPVPTPSRGSVRLGPQRTAFFTGAAIRASSAAVTSVSAKAVGSMVPSSRFAESLKPNVAYLVLNFCAAWKKQTTLPSLA